MNLVAAPEQGAKYEVSLQGRSVGLRNRVSGGRAAG